MEKNKDYTIGLDIGTSSVGWAVIDNGNWKLIRKGRKNLWGVRLFEEAEKSEGTRLARGTRRRFDRRRKRLRLLREEFKNEIDKVDQLFYKKLQESFYNSADKINKTIEISKEENQKIKDYNKKYPTIYHLRNELISNNEKKDIRLVYLAIHHIIKYRGNFLYNGQSFNIEDLEVKNKLKNVFNDFYELNNTFDFLAAPDEIDYELLEKSLFESSKNDKKQGIKDAISNVLPSKVVTEIQNLLVGNKSSINKLFELENDEDIKISFKGTEYEDNCLKLEENCGELTEILEQFKEIYDTVFLKNIFKGSKHSSLSRLMIERYNQHRDDLKFLKKIMKNDSKEYKSIFKTIPGKEHTKEACLYEKYINNLLSYDDFIKEVKHSLEKVLEKCTDQNLINEYVNVKLDAINNGIFLPRITDADNGKYPYQLNKDELLKIIELQGQYYPFMKETTNDGTYKIVKLLEFRIPYYVGPLNNSTHVKGVENVNAWLKLKDTKVNITPYNFDEIVDKDASAEEFIKRMISHCTYLLDEYAMPANSILYSKFKVLNELKQISIDGKRISKELQEEIYKGLFLKTNKTITENMLRMFLKQSKNGYMCNECDIKGFSADKKFANSMKSYVDFFGENGIFSNTPYIEKDAEEIIEWITIFEDKTILERKIRNKYDKLSETSIKNILSKRYAGWSELSEKLLENIKFRDSKTNAYKSIMDLMIETEDNFMQILNKKEYGFQEKIGELNQLDNSDKITYDIVKKLTTSPANKRGIWQAIKLVDELVEYIGYKPKNISIEMARGEDKTKKRTESRKDYLIKTYEACKKDIEKYAKLKEEIKENDDYKFSNEKLYLYFIQEGKSLYSGNPLDIENLESYEVDHIIPRTLIKDDSFDNKALVTREENQVKAANYVLPEQYRTNSNKLWWEKLNKCGLISQKKLKNLKRTYYTKEDIEGFVNRQLVETRQISKHVANIFNSIYKGTEVIYLHAGLSHNYREKNELFKFRNINDYHHAHDAYLAAILGEYKATKFKETDFEALKELAKKYREDKKYKELNYGYVINSLSVDSFDEKTGERTYNAEQFNNRVINTLYQNDILITKKTEIRTGEFYNQTKNKKGNAGVSLKKNLPTNLYGSYTSLNPAYAIVVKYTQKGKENQKMIGIPIFVDKCENERINYIRTLLKLKESDKLAIIKDRIPFFSLFNWQGQICYLVGATDKIEVCNAKQFSIEKNKYIKWKNSLNYLFNKKEKDSYEKFNLKESNYEQSIDEIIDYIIKKVEKEYELYKNLVEDMKSKFLAENLEINQKELIIKEMFNLLKTNSKCANLKNLNNEYSSAFGKKHSRIIEHAIIINTSSTGLITKKHEF